ncbi:MAG: hypothetical protein KY457_06440 [Actinobacteria bacterium]|nr:hypothetical protein [Actinomycetota bacterium]
MAAKPAVVRDGDRWYLSDDLGGGAADRGYGYGNDDALHVMGDWDGDGSRTPGVVRPEEDPAFSERDEIPLVWYLRNTNDAGPADIVLRYGVATSRETYDTPVVGDWDGDGVETIGVVRVERDPDRFEWRLRNDNSTGEPDVTFHYGEPGGFGMMSPEALRDVPVAGDWDGDGVTTAGVVRQDPSTDTAHWLLRNDNSAGESDIRSHYGRAGDRPLVGDWDGDGDETPGAHRDRNRWLLTDTHAGGAAHHDFRYGAATDRPIVWR